MYICKDVIIDKSGVTYQTFHKLLHTVGLSIKSCYSKEELELIAKSIPDNHPKRYKMKQVIKEFVS